MTRKTIYRVVLTLTLGAVVALTNALAAQLKPSVLEPDAGPGATVELAFDPDRMWPKPRSEIVDVLWWCWMPDPMPQECKEPQCDDPHPADPICGSKVGEADGKLTYEFKAQDLIDKAGEICGEVPFVVKARFDDNTVGELQGEAEIACAESERTEGDPEK